MSARESLITQLVQETGLNDPQARVFLNALAFRMGEDLKASGVFLMPSVGTLVLAQPAAKAGDDPIDLASTEMVLHHWPWTHRSEGAVALQDTSVPAALAQVVDEAEKIYLTGIEHAASLADAPAKKRAKPRGARSKKSEPA